MDRFLILMKYVFLKENLQCLIEGIATNRCNSFSGASSSTACIMPAV